MRIEFHLSDLQTFLSHQIVRKLKFVSKLKYSVADIGEFPVSSGFPPLSQQQSDHPYYQKQGQ